MQWGFFAASLLFGTLVSGASAKEIMPEQREFFESKVRPILTEHCYSCHNSVDKMKGDLALDYRGGVLAKVVIPGDPAKSPLIRPVKHDKDVEPMPSKAPKLSSLSIKHLEEWIAMGAPDPRVEKPTKAELAGQMDWGAIRDRRARWWSFQPVVKTEAPQAEDLQWDGGAINQFLFAGLKAGGLQPAPVADPGTLVRRLHLIVTGLPPSPDVVAAFVAQSTEAAYTALVEGLLASPRYGERWARYWMDWYRYTESHGSNGDPTVPRASQYRAYLIRAFNADVPGDQLIREHLAGDLLPKPRINAELGINESAIGPAHLRMVPYGFGVTDAYDEQITFTDNQIDVVTKAMLGMTVSCARCHNHKFDPISQADFYKFYGIMVSSRPATMNIDSTELQNLHRAAIEKLKGEIRSGFAAQWLGDIDAVMGQMEKTELGGFDDKHPLGAWARLRKLEPAELKQQLDAMRAAFAAGLAHNEQVKKSATFYADLRAQATFDQWSRNGNGIGAKVSPAGSFALEHGGDKVFTGIYPAGIYSHLISSKHSGVIGNHDYESKTSRKAYEDVFPDRLNYHFQHQGWQIVAFDSTEGNLGGGTTVQPATLQWLDDTLPKLDRKLPLLAFTHFPLGPKVNTRSLNADAVLERFKAHNLQATFSGHWHSFTEREARGAAVVTNRCCSFAKGNFDNTPEKGYFVCRAKDGKITREFVEAPKA